MKVHIRRLILTASIGVIALLALLYGFWPKAVLVEAAGTVRGPFLVTIEEEGKTRVKDRFICSAPVAGFLRRIALKAGDEVKKGEPLFILEPLRSQVLDPRSRAEAQFAVSAAQASVKEAEEREQSLKVDVDFTANRYARFKLLYDSGLITKDEFDRVETQARQAQAVYHAAQATTAVMRSELKRRQSVLADYAVSVPNEDQETVVVRSPKTGRVLKLYRESEGAVIMGEPVIEIGDPKDIEVRVELLSGDAVKIRPGTPVAFERWGGAPPLKGKVRTIEPSGFTKISSLGVEEQRVLVIVDMTSDPNIRSQLGDGYRVEARFTVWEGQDVLQVPASALFRAGEKWAVFTLDGGRARRQFVEVGHRNGLHAEILSGILEGAVVITQPDDAIKEGSRIRVRTAGK